MTKKQKKRVNKKIIPVMKHLAKIEKFFDDKDTTDFSKKDVKSIKKDMCELIDEYVWARKKGILDEVCELVSENVEKVEKVDKLD